MKQQFEVKNVLMDLFLTNMQLLSSPDVNWVLWIIVMFLSDSHSDGTHSLKSIHCWDTDAETHFYKPDEETNSSTSWIVWGWAHFQHNSIFGWTIRLKCLSDWDQTFLYHLCRLHKYTFVSWLMDMQTFSDEINKYILIVCNCTIVDVSQIPFRVSLMHKSGLICSLKMLVWFGKNRDMIWKMTFEKKSNTFPKPNGPYHGCAHYINNNK